MTLHNFKFPCNKYSAQSVHSSFGIRSNQKIIMHSVTILCISLLFCHIVHCLPPPVTDSGCPVGAYLNGDLCYIYFNNADSDFDQAQYTCEITGGQLATVRNVGDWRFLQALTIYKNYYRYWIAVNDRATEGQWTSGDSNPLTFANGHTGEPNGGSAIDCATIAPKFGYRWTDENCNSAFGYVCQFQNTASNCQNGRIREGTFCYEAFEERVTAATANTKCVQIGGFLADPKNDNEHNAIVRSIHSNRSWRNLATSQINTFASLLQDFAIPYIGIVRSGSGFVNNDRTATITDFGTNEPNNVGGTERCVTIQASLKMADSICNGSNSFICQYPSTSTGVSLG